MLRRMSLVSNHSRSPTAAASSLPMTGATSGRSATIAASRQQSDGSPTPPPTPQSTSAPDLIPQSYWRLKRHPQSGSAASFPGTCAPETAPNSSKLPDFPSRPLESRRKSSCRRKGCVHRSDPRSRSFFPEHPPAKRRATSPIWFPVGTPRGTPHDCRLQSNRRHAHTIR